jgi:hypothetical protein
MAPSGKSAPLPGPPNPYHFIHPNTKTENFYDAPNLFAVVFLASLQLEAAKAFSQLDIISPKF